MTTADVIGAVLRRWYLMLLGAAISLGALYVATHQQPVYFTQFNMVLIGPNADDDSNYLRSVVYSLHPVVGVVVSDVNNGEPPLPTASVEAIMVGQGVREGVQVRTVNQGSQWQPAFHSDHMDVQVAADSPEAVTAGARRAVSLISRSLQARQDQARVPRGMRITALASSNDPPVHVVQGSRVRAAAATGLAGAATTTLLVVWIDRLLLRRRRKTEIDT